MVELTAPAAVIGDVLLNHLDDYVDEDTLATASGQTGYAVRWYIHQLREAGYVVDAAMYVDREAFRAGKRGWRLVDVQTTPYRPTGSKVEDVPEPPTSVCAIQGLKVEHQKYGRGVVTFAAPGAPLIVARFPKHPRVTLPRTELKARIGSVLVLID